MAERPKIYQEINQLYSEVLEYRNSGKLEELLRFCASHQTIGAYNAMLVHMQMPGAQLVLSRSKWEREFYRRIRPNAHPLMILVPFGPVDFVFDVSHTELIPGAPDVAERKLDALLHPFRTIGIINLSVLNILEHNLRYYGIYYSNDYYAGPAECAQIQPYKRKISYEEQRWGMYFTIPFPLSYQLSVDYRKEPEVQFVSICHELGHFFCKHFEEKGKRNPMEEEFEAEIVAWLVASRLGFKDSGSVPFLSQYVGPDGRLPKINIGTVLSAADQIEKMFALIDIKKSWLYKNSEAFKENVDLILKKP